MTGGVPVPISGTVTASFSQFAPNGNYSTPLVVGATSGHFGASRGRWRNRRYLYNVGANAAYVQLGNTSVVATVADDQVALAVPLPRRWGKCGHCRDRNRKNPPRSTSLAVLADAPDLVVASAEARAAPTFSRPPTLQIVLRV